ncbi:MAG: DUF779 domain-containing protein, partial [Sphingopyxis sp.]
MTMNTQPPARITATDAAIDLLRAIQADHGAVIFHQSGGCCDGSSPMCYPASDFRLGERDVLLGHVAGAPVYIGADQHSVWQHTQLILDCVDGRGGMFSLDNGRERRFLTRSRIFTADEQRALAVDAMH